MFTRISNSWELLKASARVLRADKELLVFPLVSGVGLILISLTFFVPFLFSGLADSILPGSFEIFGFIVIFIFYIVQYAVIFLSNTALVGAALIRLRGGDPTLSDGFRIAVSRIIPILGYAVIAATVGVILRAISERSNILGRIVVGIIGLAWNVATYLVVPILAVENVGPIAAIKRSTQLLQKTWGEQIVGNLGMGALMGFINIFVLLLGIGAIAVSFMLELHFLVYVAIGALLVLTLLMLGLVSSTLNGIYVAAVYQYANDGQTGDFFEADLVQNAFRVR
ncbi:MAG: hypothetical protein FVQ82_17440 [Planctomycetes bacterium]|nr:hypothetical protein [Planctomycetota bacterium]